MVQAKRARKGKHAVKATSVLGAAGVTLAATTGGAPAGAPFQEDAPFPSANFDRSLVLGEEDVTDVSLATFHLFDRDAIGAQPSVIQVARGCGCGRGCGGCRGCRGCRGCGGCRGCRGCGWGGCGGCGGGWGYGYGGCCLTWGGCYPWC